jgi:hypothetical protein
LLGRFVWRDITVRYKQTFLGVAWALLVPIFAAAVYTVVFGKFANFPSGSVPYPALVLSGVLVMQYFTSSLGGLDFAIGGATTGVIPTNIYTIVMLFRLDQTNGYRRLLDFKAASIDTGLYVRDGRLNFYPVVEAASPSIPAGTYVQVVLTRDSASNVVAYVNGVQQLTFVDASLRAVLTGANDLRCFKDDSGEESGGAVARIRLYAAAMPAGQVALLDRVDCGCNPPQFMPSEGRVYFTRNA